MRVVQLVLILALVFSQNAFAEGQLIVVESKFDVKESADRLVAALGEKGIKVVARIDHAAGAKAAGLDMPPTEVVMFGNPKLGTPLMLANPEIAVELPMKIVIWQDKGGKIQLGYLNPSSLKQRYAISDKDEVFNAMSSALAGLSKSAADAN